MSSFSQLFHRHATAVVCFPFVFHLFTRLLFIDGRILCRKSSKRKTVCCFQLSGNYLPGSDAMIASSPWTAHSETPFGIIQLVPFSNGYVFRQRQGLLLLRLPSSMYKGLVFERCDSFNIPLIYIENSVSK